MKVVRRLAVIAILLNMGSAAGLGVPVQVIGTCNSSGLRVRSAPNLEGEIVTSIDEDETVEILDISRNKMTIGDMWDYWYQVRTNPADPDADHVEGWAYGYFLDISANELLVLAAMKGRIGLAAALLDEGADVEAGVRTHVENEEYWTNALLTAVDDNDHDMVELLLSRRAEPDVARHYSTPASASNSYALVTALANGYNDVAAALIDAGADPEVESSHAFFLGGTHSYQTALAAAARTGNMAGVRLLLEAGADVFHGETDSGPRDEQTISPASIAAEQGFTQIAQFLRSNSPWVDEFGAAGVTARPGIYFVTSDSGDIYLRSDGVPVPIPKDRAAVWNLKAGYIMRPDGELVVYSRFDDADLFGARRDDGYQEVRVYQADQHGYAFLYPADFSPDGRELLFVAGRSDKGRDLCILALDENRFRVVKAFDDAFFEARWLRDGKRIMIILRDQRDDEGRSAVYLLDRSGGELQYVSHLPWSYSLAVSTNKSNQSIVDGSKEKTFDGWIDLETSQVVYFNHDPEMNSDYHWSPDETRLAFSSKRDGNWDVYIMDADGGNLRQLTDRPEIERCAGWIDGDAGQRIVFQRSSKETYVSEGSGIYTITPAGTDVRLLWSDSYAEELGPKACPFLYVYGDGGYVKLGEILGDLMDESLEKMEARRIRPEFVVNGRLKIRIAEERHELTFLNAVALRAGGRLLKPRACPPSLSAEDDRYLELSCGEHVDLSFEIPSGSEDDLELLCTGFYKPQR